MKTLEPTLLTSIVLDPQLNAPLYVQLRDALGAIIEKSLKNGDLFFSDLELVQRLEISRFTVRQAVDELVRAGYLVRRRGQGTFVTRSEKPSPTLSHVGAFIGSYESENATSMLDMLSRECARRGILLHVYYTENGNRINDAYKRVTRSPQEEGLLFLNYANELYSALRERGYRTVALEADVIDYRGPSVETDCSAAVHIGMQHLMDLGHSDVTLLLTEPATSLSVREKVNAFEEIAAHYAMKNARVVDAGVPERGSPRECSYRAMGEIMAQPSHPTAIFTVSDFGAFGVLNWCRDNGVAVPDELSVLGYEGIRSGEFVTPALTSVAHPTKHLAATLIDMLVRDEHKQKKLCPPLVRRASTGPAPTR